MKHLAGRAALPRRVHREFDKAAQQRRPTFRFEFTSRCEQAMEWFVFTASDDKAVPVRRATTKPSSTFRTFFI